MNEQTFVEKRQENWSRLIQLTDIAESSIGALTGDKLKEFVRLYREAAKDLATVRSQSSNEPLAQYLNDIVSRAYSSFYTYRRPKFLEVIGVWIETSAQTVRRNFIFVLVSVALFMGSGFFKFALMQARPDLKDALATKGMEANTAHWVSDDKPDRDSSQSLMAWSMYASNNPRASLMGAGISVSTFGIGTAYVLIQNGGMIGELASAMYDHGKLTFLIGSLLPHGVPEISGLILCGAAGLSMGWAVIAPGRRKRGDALGVAARDGITLTLTSVALMFIAAPIEGFFSFNTQIPLFLKFSVALVEMIAWATFWTMIGRPTQAKAPTLA